MQAPEKKEEQGLRERMTHLLARVQELQRTASQRPSAPAKSGRHRATQQEVTQAAKESNIEIISAILGAMEQVGRWLGDGVAGTGGCVGSGCVGVGVWGRTCCSKSPSPLPLIAVVESILAVLQQ